MNCPLFEMLKAKEFQEIIREAYIYTQEQFTVIYNDYLRFAYAKAGRYFRDKVLREAAAEEAVTKAFDSWWKKDSSKPLDDERIKRIIRNSLQYASQKQELEPVNLPDIDEYYGYHGYRVK